MSATLRSARLPARFAIMGAARSGLAAARALLERGHSVFISDTCESHKLDFLLASNDLAQVPHEAGEHTERVLDCDVIVLSPGIAQSIEVLALARKRKIPVWSEIELAYRLSVARVWAVTGSTGKSTTVTMIGAIAQAAGLENAVCGNIGIAMVALAPRLGQAGVAVVEVSSFQLETIDQFTPEIALITNFMKNHLDRYENEQAYYTAKKQLARNMDSTATLVLNAQDSALREWGKTLSGKVQVVWYGVAMPGERSVWHSDGFLYSTMQGGEPRRILDVSGMVIAGRHNYDNASGAAAVALAGGVSEEAVGQGLCAARSLPHRLELVATKGGVRWFNDSKSTTAESVGAAVSAFGKKVFLIAGGRDKGCDFKSIVPLVAQYVQKAILIGEAAGRMASIWKNVTMITRADSLAAAVAHAAARAVDGDIVVLSPGCSSFDMFASYEERGASFAQLVKELPELSRAEK